MKYTSLDVRMKRYEAVSDVFLMRRTPVILRFDMCHGHTFTKGFDKPFDSVYMATMQKTMEALCNDIQGAVFGYTQSDEITIVLCDYKTFETSAWFDNRLEKLCSVGASKASRYFNKFFMEIVEKRISIDNTNAIDEVFADIFGKQYNRKGNKEIEPLSDKLRDKYRSRYFTADFDCRAFNIPKEEVCNCVIWRQNDAEKNSIQSLAQSLYSHNELKGLKCNQLQNKMFTEKGVNWSELPTYCKRGSACIKNENGKWFIDYDMPILKENRDYLERFVYCEEE